VCLPKKIVPWASLAVVLPSKRWSVKGQALAENTFRLSGSTSNNLNINTIRIELGAAETGGVQILHVIMEGNKFGSQHIGSRLEVTWKLNGEGLSFVGHYLICPFVYQIFF
jgi:hypothetical protein